ncbi:MAG: phosphoribosylglycinamide formyltransferase [uncultured bacterium]|nr:MAG: phosphoribosylglycinamide formyltransferase [uncultured bacterium]OGT27140.1 MAG: hypothetical protein A3B71_08530 [Gammaproteobacteria bacterium RIFCSPHIGHO2_02_FULL_42_43]OGT29304.1 MAG: hypothetical protein A2624_04705 [Gammaproteobacteria bacterium RIFCSPHIGHO2_01_FULL_42_8]OGT50755.1 MAG: hypothetical protein A3E54_00725 [Gammaproteobacteria bacterium RIFCSPHIGHO2_12_FULL_41_25]OGT61740.1 MAG: hypothetical protein A3I77_00445 [Gammaproteobacteria bacterium RIFCSPLOWO2_02_FULL_42_14
MNVFKISVLGSTRGSNLPGLYQKLLNTSAKIVDVLSDKPHAGILQKAKQLGLSNCYIPIVNFEKKLNAHLINNGTDLLVLIGFMKILSPFFVSRWRNKIINVHPSLLPKYAGLMNLNVHRAVLDAKEIQTGCTVHWVTEQVDAGAVILQKKCDVFLSDHLEILKERVQQLEIPALVEAIEKIRG